MNNSITATISFSFKGETFSPSATIDLDALYSSRPVLETGTIPQYVYNMIAKSGNIDTYSYAYEVMLASDVVFSEPQGLAVGCLQDNTFDFSAFQHLWDYQNKLKIVQKIAQKHMQIDNLEQHPNLRDALLEALDQQN